MRPEQNRAVNEQGPLGEIRTQARKSALWNQFGAFSEKIAKSLSRIVKCTRYIEVNPESVLPNKVRHRKKK